ncbi:hypothetical protein HanPI659440_Chr13g0521201 [Helianthus annuus]|nr:hypothetical protein HanPI659440_Chr13g0521201 [Helianthus annuus]
MMIGRLNRKARPVLREKNDDGLTEEAPLWRMFCPDFEGKVDIVTCGAGEEGWNRTIICSFRMPDEAALNAVLPGGKGGSAGAGGATTRTKPVDVKKRKGDAHVAGGEEVPELRKTRMTAVPKPNPAVSTGKLIVNFASFIAAEYLIDAFFFYKIHERTGFLVCHPSFFTESSGRGSLEERW